MGGGTSTDFSSLFITQVPYSPARDVVCTCLKPTHHPGLAQASLGSPHELLSPALLLSHGTFAFSSSSEPILTLAEQILLPLLVLSTPTPHRRYTGGC